MDLGPALHAVGTALDFVQTQIADYGSTAITGIGLNGKPVTTTERVLSGVVAGSATFVEFAGAVKGGLNSLRSLGTSSFKKGGDDFAASVDDLAGGSPPDAGGLDDIAAAAAAGQSAKKSAASVVPRGKLIGSVGDLTPAERGFVEKMLAEGKRVEVIPRGSGRTPDFRINNKSIELKTLDGVKDQSADGISSAMASRIMDGRGQSTNIVVDASNQSGITQGIAERGVRRAFGADNARGAKIESIEVIGPEFKITVPRTPSE